MTIFHFIIQIINLKKWFSMAMLVYQLVMRPKLKNGNHHHPASKSPRGPLLGCSIAPSKRFWQKPSKPNMIKMTQLPIFSPNSQNSPLPEFIMFYSNSSPPTRMNWSHHHVPCPWLLSPALVSSCSEMNSMDLRNDECSGLHYPY